MLTGIVETDEDIVDGSFALRAERDRLGLPPPVAVVIPPVPIAVAPAQRVAIAVTKEGFVPATVQAKADVPIELVFTRRTEETCAKEVEITSLKVRKALPLNEPVSITVPASQARTLAFACGMNMLKGVVVVR